ncbi:DUF4097 family beta strand repeat-containing protein [Pedobacter aquatilis]|uniref:DUF4097 family beta strand repeat-containing protein n=1 Tax=Pedobacter aquatilis TaxID=351343 RepID=UPI0025B53B18|nr:DUF4097 family beta strand repeat-containing protein [Pedobacter aquatilis]MDN3588288.1 DUF4097 family beta strand repeat-containing protein [Pedobacter aquatilis]
MKKQFIVLFSMLAITLSASAQKEYKLSKSSGQLNLNISGAIIEGYSGNEIVFSIPTFKEEVVDERAKGLRVITGSGFTDNTGLGIDVTSQGSEINVNTVNKELKGVLTIKVPQGVKVKFTNQSNMYHSDLILKNLKSEIEVSSSYNKIKLENNSGPMSVKSLFGSIDASFLNEVKGPVSIISVYGHVDVSLPASVKANVELSSGYGKLYAADELKIAIDKTERTQTEQQANSKASTSTTTTVNGLNTIINGVKVVEGTTGFTSVFGNGRGTTISGLGLAAYGGRSSEDIKGTINGGGSNLVLKSSYENVYLRVK